ncbi:MAG: alpha/beta fold hydrolase [Acidimicrobiales bacterium]
MADPQRFQLPDGRTLAYDDVGDPEGVLIVYLHGSPDSRLARHPDDGLAAAAGVRLVALDRPGAGRSDAHPGAGLGALGADVAALLDALDATEVRLLAWSAGGLGALAVAGTLGGAVRAVTLVGTVPPVEAYAAPDVVDALGLGRRHFAELAMEVPGAELAAEMAPYLVPDPLTPEVALEHVLEGAGDVGRRELAAVSGAAEQMAAALVEAARGGIEGLAEDLALQLTPGLDLSAVRAPVLSVHGELDPVSPPAVGEWLAARLPSARVRVHPGAGHHLVFPRWVELLEATAEAG